jgi:hypothetical protein
VKVKISDAAPTEFLGQFGGTSVILCKHKLLGDVETIQWYLSRGCSRHGVTFDTRSHKTDCRRLLWLLQNAVERARESEEVVEMKEQRRIMGGKMKEEVNVVLGREENKAAGDDGVYVDGQ